MIEIKSKRACDLLVKSEIFSEEKKLSMRFFSGTFCSVWVDLEFDHINVKKMSYYGTLLDYQKVILIALEKLLKNKPLEVLESFSIRELEAFLRDRNSVAALENLPPELEGQFRLFLTWLRLWPVPSDHSTQYEFTQGKSFEQLGLVEKVSELKSFFHSENVMRIYQGRPKPEFIDISSLDIFLNVPYETEDDKALLHDLHELLVMTFREEKLNLIPES